VVINGQSQAKQTGILKWSFAPDFKVIRTVNEPGFALVCAEHYGYRRLPGAPVHRRYFAFVDETFWLMLDVLSAEGQGAFEVQWNFHFNEGVRVAPYGEGLFEISGARSGMRMLFDAPESLAWENDLFIGGKGPQYGWISPTYRARRAAPLLQINARTSFPLQVLTLFLPENEQSHWKVENNAGEVLLTSERRSYRIVKGAKVKVEFGDREFEI
jgi:hypothetical protein